MEKYTPSNKDWAYGTLSLMKVKTAADLIIPLYEPQFASLHTIP